MKILMIHYTTQVAGSSLSFSFATLFIWYVLGFFVFFCLVVRGSVIMFCACNTPRWPIIAFN